MLDSQGNMVFTRPEGPVADPLPWLTDLWRQSGCFALDLPEAVVSLANAAKTAGAARQAFSPEAQALSQVLAATKNAIDSLHSDTVGYTVHFSDKEGVPAGTDTIHKDVIVGTKALTHAGLTEGQRAAVLVGLALHETGHINDSQPFRRRTEVAFAGKPTLLLALKLHNVGDDNRVERLQVARYPNLKVALDAAAWLVTVLQTEIWTERGISDPFAADFTSAKGREKVLCMAARYPFTVDWSTVDAAERAFMLGWADRMSADHSVEDHISLISEAIEWIGDVPPQEEEEETEEGESTEGEEDDESDDTEGDDGDADGEAEDGDGGSDSEDTDDGEAGEGEGEESGDSEADADGDTEGEGEAGDGEADSGGEGEGAPGDTEGDSDGGPNVTEGEGEQKGNASETGNSEVNEGGEMPSEDGEAEDLESKNEMPDLGDDCGNDVAKDPELDTLSESVTQAHSLARSDVKRMRRYPGATGGTVVVRERRLDTAKTRVNSWDSDDFAMGTDLTEGETEAQNIARGNSDWAKRTTNATREDSNASRALAEVITSARRGADAPERGARSGRLDRGRLSRVASGNTKVFIRNTAAAPQKIRVHILLDASASMTWGGRLESAGQVARNLAGAFDLLSWTTCRMYAHTDDNLGPFLVHVWQTGEPRSNVDRYLRVPNADTPDGYALAFAADDLLADLRSGERGVLIIVSDGEPSYTAGKDHVKNVVKYYRERGIRVVSVSIADALTGESQREMYGKDVVEFNDNPRIFARNMAKVVGSSL